MPDAERTTLRLPPKLKESIEKDVNQFSDFPSVNEWLIKAAEHFLECKKAYQTASMRLIVLKYAGKCIKCGEHCEPGTWDDMCEAGHGCLNPYYNVNLPALNPPNILEDWRHVVEACDVVDIPPIEERNKDVG